MEGALALAPVLGADVAATIGRVLRRGEAATALQTAWRRHHAQRRAWGLWVRAQQGRVEFRVGAARVGALRGAGDEG